ncbi:MAG: TlpA family protein disulfide reductase [Oscillospiraceae bacterium]|nr:TlpA family protein disulfide reductase [Oscillospiraceae bacterium]
MKNKKKILIAVLVLALLLAGAYVLYNQFIGGAAGGQLTEQDRVFAPDFLVYDKDGTEVRLSDYHGEPMVVNFWASWCGPCQSEMPDFQQLYMRWDDQVQFLMINLTDGEQETLSKASQFVREKGYTFPVFFDILSEAANAYQVYSIPTTIFIDAEGYIVATYTGAISAETLQQGIDLILEDPS